MFNHDAAFANDAAEEARLAYLTAFGSACPCGTLHDGPGELCERCESAHVAVAFRAALQQVEAERCWALVAFALRVGPVAVGVTIARAS